LSQGLLSGVQHDYAALLLTIVELNSTVTTRLEGVSSFADLVRECYQVFNTLDGKSSPGYPYTLKANNYAALRADTNIYDGHDLVDTVVLAAAFKVLAVLENGNADSSAVELLSSGCGCLSTPFVKYEPNKLKKRKAPRIVIARDAADRIAVNVLFELNHPGLGNSSFCDGYGTSPSNLSKVREWLLYARSKYFSSNSNMIKSDVSGWETSFSEETMDWTMFGFSAISTSKVDLTQAYHTIGRTVTRGCFLLNRRDVVVKTTPGGQQSGHFLTTKSNSFGRMLHASEKGNIAMSMGDDTVEFSDSEDLVSRYVRTGLEVRDCEPCSVDDFEFCSGRVCTSFGVTTHAHLNYKKSIFKMLVKGVSLAQIAHSLKAGFTTALAALPFANEMTKLNDQLSVESPSLADFQPDAFNALFDDTQFSYEAGCRPSPGRMDLN